MNSMNSQFMDSFSLAFFSSVVIITIVLLQQTYQSAQAQWKRHPWIPLVGGFVLLMLAFLADWWLDAASTRSAQLIALQGAKLEGGPKSTVSSMVIAYKQQAKFMELAIMPIAVSLMVTAFSLRIERDHSTRLDEINGLLRELARIETEITDAKQAVEVAVSQAQRGTALLEAESHVKSLQLARRYTRMAVRRRRRVLGVPSEDI